MQKRWPIIFAVLAVTAVLLWNHQIRTRTTLATLKHSCDDLRLHLEANDRLLAQLQSSLEQLLQSNVHTTNAVGPLAADFSIRQQLDSLTLSQSNTMALLQKLSAGSTASQPAANAA